MKIIEIHATDWAFYDDCFTLPDDFPPIEVKIVGWLVEDKPDYVSVALEDYSKENRQKIRHVLSIPRVCIKAIYEFGAPIAGTGVKRVRDEILEPFTGKEIIGGY